MSTCSSNLPWETHKGTCSIMRTRGILPISNFFFPFIPSNPRFHQKFWAWLSYTAEKQVLCEMAVMAQTRRCSTWGDFSLPSDLCQDTKSICLPLVHHHYIFFSWRSCKLHSMQKSTLIKGKERGSTLLFSLCKTQEGSIFNTDIKGGGWELKTLIPAFFAWPLKIPLCFSWE